MFFLLFWSWYTSPSSDKYIFFYDLVEIIFCVFVLCFFSFFSSYYLLIWSFIVLHIPLIFLAWTFFPPFHCVFGLSQIALIDLFISFFCTFNTSIKAILKSLTYLGRVYYLSQLTWYLACYTLVETYFCSLLLIVFVFWLLSIWVWNDCNSRGWYLCWVGIYLIYVALCGS